MAEAPLNDILGSPASESKPAVTYRSFDDVDSMRKSIFDGVLNSVTKHYPIENTRYRMEIGNLGYDSEEPYTLEDQKKAIMSGQTLTRQLNGTWNLVDKGTNKVVDTKKTTIAHVPYVTPRGTFIYRGNEYTVANQMRLKSGIFSRVKENGLIEAHFNVKPGTGSSFRMYMEPDTGIFRLAVGQSTLKMYPIMRAMGVSDKDLEKTWGKELLQKNIEADDPRAVSRAFTKLVATRADQPEIDADQGLFKESQFTQVDQGLVVGPSKVHGNGLYTPQLIPAGARITVAYVRIGRAGNVKNDFVRSGPALWVNHQQTELANSVTAISPDGRVVDLIATRDIQPWEEITADYSKTHDMMREWIQQIYEIDSRSANHKATEMSLSKAGSIGFKETDTRWTKLWFMGTIRAQRHGHDGEPWVYVEVHKGLMDAARDSMYTLGVELEKPPGEPHISLLRSKEAKELIDKFGEEKWKGAAKDGQPIRFALKRLVSLVPDGWKGVDRVWFIEVDSPDLRKYRKDIGFDALPRGDKGHEHRFHITFAIHKVKNEVKRALYLLSGARAGIVDRAFEKAAGVTDPGIEINKVFDKMEFDPDVTTATMGEPLKNAGIATLLRTSQKLLNISKGLEDTDDRDSLAYQQLYGPEDFFAERISRDAGQTGRRLLWKSTLKGNLKHVPNGALSGQMYGVLLRSGMGMAIEETNPMDIADQNLRVIRLGEGGISSLDAVPEESRNVQPSHFGFIDPIRAPESASIGIDSRVSHRVMKGSDGQFHTSMFNPRTGKEDVVSAAMAARSVVAFPGELSKKGNKVRAMVKSRQIEYVDRDAVDYELENPNQLFTLTSNLVPMVSGIKGGRLLMGAKYFSQALPLRDREAPLVRNVDRSGKSFAELAGSQMGAIRANSPGVVVSMNKNVIKMKYADGTTKSHELYRNFPFNRKTFIHSEPAVKIGDQVQKGQLLASSNYTDAEGTLALGTNLRTAYMPYKGLNYEDAVVISEGAAKRLSSEHMYQHTLEKEDDVVTGRKQYVSIYPATFNRKQLETLDERGVVKVGSTIKFGDPVVLAMRKNQISAVHKGHKPMFSNAAITWDHETPGMVTGVDETDSGNFNVTIKSYAPAQEGDKLAGAFGDKGVISKVVPDDQMIRDKDGKPYEILLNPLGIITRGNPSQVFEALLGKVARKRGKPINVPSFMDESLVEYVKRELGREGLSSQDDVYDPTTNRKIPKILTGDRFIFKLHHTAESKGKGRDIGAYTSEGIPAKGGELGSKRVSNMEINALLSHGATNVLHDAQVVRGQRNDDFWRAFKLGNTPPSPKVPMIYEKFLSHLRGAGINLKKNGERTQLLAMTDKEVDKLSSGEITLPKTVDGETLTEIDGGLFDRGKTGGHGGNRWSHIQLTESLPNPTMEEPIRRMLGLTKIKFEEVLEGKQELGGSTGAKAIGAALKRINLDESIESAKMIIQDGAQSKRDNAVKLLGYYQTLKKADMRPSDLMMSKVPVLPPNFRPITKHQSMQLSADANFLYRDLMIANNDLKEISSELGERRGGRARLRAYHSFKAVTGLGDPVQPKTQEKRVKGLLAHIFGDSPKTGMFQRRVLGSPVDVVGRAAITPNPSLSMDQVGIPEEKAWTIYRPFLVRRLIRRGMPAMEAAKAVANRTDVAAKSLQEEISERPVLINRAPTLHRYGFMAAWPVITKGKTLQVSPVVVGGFNADFDGDAMNYHVPVTDDAVKDAVDRMLPSKNLKSVRFFDTHYVPKNEFLMGLFLASTAKNKNAPKVFKDKQAVLAAYQRGELNLGDSVSIRS
jgi:DNA-directed RNA polymerase beta subunit